MNWLYYIVLFLFGAIMGSFVTCQAHRIRNYDKKHQKLGKRSVCMSCKKQLKWYDNIPIISWLILHGKCRYCKKKIGIAEILMEILMGVAFAAILYWYGMPQGFLQWSVLILTLILVCFLGFLAVYDGKWGELPDFALGFSLVVALVIAICKMWGISNYGDVIINTILAVGILGGLYLVLYLISRGKWVGNGDWILGVICGIVLGDWWLSMIALFFANFLGTVIMYPIVKKQKESRIHFGPFLIIGMMVALVFGEFWQSLI